MPPFWFAAGDPVSMPFATVLELDRCAFFTLSLCPHHRRAAAKALVFARFPSARHLHPSLLRSRRFYSAFVSSAGGNQLDSNKHKPVTIEAAEALIIEPEQQKDGGQLRKRVFSGLAIGIGGGGVVVAGGWVFTAVVAVAVFAAAREYFELVRSQGIAAGMTPPPRYVSRTCSVICALMPVLTAYFGHIDVSVTSSAFLVAMALICQRAIPRFSQLSSTMFGLFYCAYLPCFWVKLRCGLAAPALHTELGKYWPILLGGRAHWTVGLVATIISVSSIIAADTFAFIGGRAFGRTPLTSISPKKTLEGAFAGLIGCIAVAITLSRILSWPSSLLSASAFGILNFISSLFGDLTESMIKRDAGVKDSGSLIPGHGGVLDRLDSYLFTGALCYSFVKFALPLFGV
ncbi:phosphatidate cytidylyltransferase 4, chloroplastic-like [Phalaenopsis equestris]|uniref:phosphatidate cytidylyltransferase 4, chloroplastic-like n=1 Tax=Phalaenopsis equestris TaxID=78828 RepID=UPI0009E3DDAF|nr:phosphatidate cytidylyltransferase 4, chloroplastic-like [Phalaenopsis equestris]